MVLPEAFRTSNNINPTFQTPVSTDRMMLG